MIRRYSPIQLFNKLKPYQKTVVLKGFYLYYLDTAINPTKYTQEKLDEEIRDHIELYDNTRLFNDGELVQLCINYFQDAMDENMWSKKYPEWFI